MSKCTLSQQVFFFSLTMVPKVSQLFTFMFLLFPLLFIFCDARSPPKNGKNSPFEFLEHLQGCRKGEKVEGLYELKKYLEKFGYLHYQNNTHANDDNFDDLLESAIKTYQLYYHLNTTGVLDAHTISKMMMPRCGTADNINGKNWREAGQKHHHHGLSKIHTVSHYKFFNNSPRWPPLKTQLTYGFLQGTPPDAISAVANAFDDWASVSNLTFSQTQTNYDLEIGFYSGYHGDDCPFDGTDSTLAYAYAPQDGRFHYNADVNWVVGSVPNSFDYETTALHEIGHLLGLAHSEVEDAIMYAYLPRGMTKGLNDDDIQGIRALYN